MPTNAIWSCQVSISIVIIALNLLPIFLCILYSKHHHHHQPQSKRVARTHLHQIFFVCQRPTTHTASSLLQLWGHPFKMPTNTKYVAKSGGYVYSVPSITNRYWLLWGVSRPALLLRVGGCIDKKLVQSNVEAEGGEGQLEL